MDSQPIFGTEFFAKKILSVAKLRAIIFTLCISNIRCIILLKDTLLNLSQQMEEIGKNKLTSAERKHFGYLAGLVEITLQGLATKERELNEKKFHYSTVRNDFVTEATNSQNFEDVLDLVRKTKTKNPEFWPEAINLVWMFFNKPLRHPEQQPHEFFVGNFFTSDLSSYKALLESYGDFTNPEVAAVSLPNVVSIGYASARVGITAYSVSKYNSCHTYPIIPYLRPVFANKSEVAGMKNSIRV
jgi:hypothetical protein